MISENTLKKVIFPFRLMCSVLKFPIHRADSRNQSQIVCMLVLLILFIYQCPVINLSLKNMHFEFICEK